jgi:deoxyribose-phosphate aldolase
MDIQIPSRVELVFAGELPTRANVDRLCAAACREKYRCVVVPSAVLLLAHHFLEDSEVKVSCRIGFPHGVVDADVKRYEAELAVDAGAHEIELLPSLAKVVDGDYTALLREMRDVVEAADERPVKVALQPSRWETGALRELIQLVLDSGAQFICADKPEIQQIELLRNLCGPEFGIVARAETMEKAEQLLARGANLVALDGD